MSVDGMFLPATPGELVLYLVLGVVGTAVAVLFACALRFAGRTIWGKGIPPEEDPSD